jgi:hypothetical protein
MMSPLPTTHELSLRTVARIGILHVLCKPVLQAACSRKAFDGREHEVTLRLLSFVWQYNEMRQRALTARMAAEDYGDNVGLDRMLSKTSEHSKGIAS